MIIIQIFAPDNMQETRLLKAYTKEIVTYVSSPTYLIVSLRVKVQYFYSVLLLKSIDLILVHVRALKRFRKKLF